MITAVVLVFVPNLPLAVYAVLVGMVGVGGVVIGVVQSFRYLYQITK
jgi:hypothetical protein